MAAMIPPSLEERVAQLEETTASLLATFQKGRQPNWRQVVGMFGDAELMREIDEEGRRWREEENRRSLP